jgi:NAD(P)-dependent dehydrogenase (short-subunit alcohol dehydrogenase family)
MPNTATDNISAALQPDRVAVITGAASGIGLATAKTLAGRGLKVVIADREGPALYQAIRDLAAIAAGGEDDVLGFACDVSRPDDVEKLADAAYEKFGEVAFLMNNAGIGANPGKPWENREDWKALIEVNFWGAVYGVEAFAPRMIEAGAPGLIVNTGSKQGITTPPGEPAYNVSKAGVKAFTEALQHELRNTEGCKISAHLLIPGHVFTGLTARGRTDKPAGAWTPEQTVDFMIAHIDAGDFYILCPDNDVPRQLDERRMQWAAGDIVENRPALSRWHPDYAEAFARFVKGG